MEAPVLPVGNFTERWPAEGSNTFVKTLQEALIARGYMSAPADGVYDYRTAQALERFQAQHPVSTFPDKWYAIIGFNVASCATYNTLLGEGAVTKVFLVEVGPITPRVIMLVDAAVKAGKISLSCYPSNGGGGTQPPPSQPPVAPRPPYLLYAGIALGAAGLTLLIITLVRKAGR